MKHEQRPWGSPTCLCGYAANGPYARKLLDIHFRSSHDFHEHVEIIRQLTSWSAEHPNANQDLALAILHLTECMEEIESRTTPWD